MKNLPLHWKILIGMALGIVVGILAVSLSWEQFISNWVKPWGTIFINLLKLIAIPLIVASLIKGISDLKDINELSKMGGRTIGLYILSTVIAITIGLGVVNIIQPGNGISEETRETFVSKYEGEVQGKIEAASEKKGESPLQFVVDLVPDNIIGAAASNRNMLQVIFFVILFAIGIILVPENKAGPVKEFFDGLNEVVLKIIDLIMLFAPYGVFALMAGIVADVPNADIFVALGMYTVSVLIGLALMIVVYTLFVKFYVGKSPAWFLRQISPAQLVAFSTSSSAATLPVTMERVEEHLGVHKQVSSFVLPIGATVNMDGTSLYQGVAAVFIAQVFGIDLSLGDQLTIVLTAVLASIGSAAVPSAGMVMLVIVLEAINVPAAGLALIFAVDRPLDMCRTVINITGDSTISMMVGKSLNLIGRPSPKQWDDHYEPAGE